MNGQTPDYVDLFEHAPAGYMLLDGDGVIETINHTGAAMLGWEATWLTGKPFARWVNSNDRQLFDSHRQQVHRCANCISLELRIKNRQGRSVNLRLESLRQEGANKGTPGCRCIMVDISGEEQSARRLRRLQAQLAHVARLHTAGELATSLAHELNQPLGTVVLNCEAALRLMNSGDGKDFEFATALTQATEAASFASDVIRNLRNFLRKNGEQHRACTLSDLIRDVTALIETDARDHDIQLCVDIQPDIPAMYGDPVQIGQVLVNLVHNSIEAMREHDEPRPASVRITACHLSPDQIRVSVSDTGPGLDAVQLERVFSPFYSTKRHGMGMGLSISRNIVEAHGGRLWADPEPGDGATLHFTLPITGHDTHVD